MTREEAKEVFLNRGFIDGIYNGDKWRESCVVISKWLEQESTTKNDLAVDCISRQATINAVKRIHPVDTDYDCTLYDKVDVMYVLDEMPSVTPQEPRKGHWEHGEALGGEYQGKTLVDIIYEDWHCSNCHCVIEQSSKPKWSYCPSCGAKMVEPQESEE